MISFHFILRAPALVLQALLTVNLSLRLCWCLHNMLATLPQLSCRCSISKFSLFPSDNSPAEMFANCCLRPLCRSVFASKRERVKTAPNERRIHARNATISSPALRQFSRENNSTFLLAQKRVDWLECKFPPTCPMLCLLCTRAAPRRYNWLPARFGRRHKRVCAGEGRRADSCDCSSRIACFH